MIKTTLFLDYIVTKLANKGTSMDAINKNIKIQDNTFLILTLFFIFYHLTFLFFTSTNKTTAISISVLHSKITTGSFGTSLILLV